MSRVDLLTLPGEFFDTLGAIQEDLGKPRDAEASYTRGLRKSPEHPVLNFHMGKLLSSDPKRTNEALEHFKKAEARQSSLSPAMRVELAERTQRIRRGPTKPE
jgi:hypothetical protein